ncbi:MAG: bifunctional [glutamate--ammonia ligase]-adenylyl-L-tyrosine phosphorylase/[glutamate--ammonia-ligase] adenylyltransferase [Gammaproteobacteria bacterium]|nr:MAG: bifunctional [glutamate--ammonia ligase]-adenylyl-L-tyrosine phosphorylase/[glutamate--ammonia-ligase] adenylyltransferase [Gammaproteobacteria bacterium]
MSQQLLVISESAKRIWQEFNNLLLASDYPVDDAFQQQALRVFTLSEFVAKQCQRRPELLLQLLLDNRLEKDFSFEEFDSNLQMLLEKVDTEQQLASSLRFFRNQQMVAIYWRDLLDLTAVKITCQQMSYLADVCILQSTQWLYQKQCLEMGIQLGDGLTDPPQQLIVIAMGKLGGSELNVSSDIDLIFCYQKNQAIRASNRRIDQEKFINLLGRKVIKSLDQITVDGFVFRVDMRLRPYGDSGPLVMSFSALEEYYQDQGRDWERFALIKSRPITGSKEAKHQLIALLKPFIYRRYIDYSVLESPRQMKNLINQELRRRNLVDNIKLGPGGIREVEFIAQALQLIHGGRETSLQCRSLFKSLPRLAELNLLSLDVVDELMDCYLFLRKVEHRLQAAKDQQTQALPLDEIQQLRLAASLNFADWQSFREKVSVTMDTIHQHFSDMFKDESDQKKQYQTEIIYDDIWQDFTSMDSNVESLLEQGSFKDVSNIANQLLSFRESSSLRHMGPRGAKRLDQLMPSILQSIAGMADQNESLKRILSLLTSITRRTAYLELLGENKGALDQMIKLCSASARIADQIADYPYVLDELINPNTLFHPPEISQFPDMLRQLLCRIPEDDPELQMDCLREFRQINLLRVTAADIAGALSLRQVSRYLTAIAETVIEAVVNLAWQQLRHKHGDPESENNIIQSEQDNDYQGSLSEGSSLGFAIIAYGKLGGHELGYASDLDLVFLHDADTGMTDGEKPIENNVFFMRLAQKIIHLLSIRTRSGVLYEVDMRLRPSGNSGLLVSHIDSFSDYQYESAWTWEHQALIRGRCILGPVSIRQQFEKIRTAIICGERDVEKLKLHVVEMREKMRDSLLEPNLSAKGLFNLKQSPGGIADIEFITQFLVLKLASTDSTLAISSNTTELLSSLARNDPRLKILVSVYAQLRRLINENAIQNQSNTLEDNFLTEIDTQVVVDLWNDLLG